MVEVKKGTTISSGNLKSGVKKDGTKWLYGLVIAQQGYDTIKVWAENPEIGKDSDVQVVSISQAKITNRKIQKKDGSEAWATDFNINAKLEPLQMSIPEGFSMIEDDSIPF